MGTIGPALTGSPVALIKNQSLSASGSLVRLTAVYGLQLVANKCHRHDKLHLLSFIDFLLLFGQLLDSKGHFECPSAFRF